MPKRVEYISVTEAVNVLKRSRVTIYKWIAAARLDSAEIAGRTVVIKNHKFLKVALAARKEKAS